MAWFALILQTVNRNRVKRDHLSFLNQFKREQIKNSLQKISVYVYCVMCNVYAFCYQGTYYQKLIFTHTNYNIYALQETRIKGRSENNF